MGAWLCRKKGVCLNVALLIRLGRAFVFKRQRKDVKSILYVDANLGIETKLGLKSHGLDSYPFTQVKFGCPPVQGAKNAAMIQNKRIASPYKIDLKRQPCIAYEPPLKLSPWVQNRLLPYPSILWA